jgi:DNA-binding transcriptional LysR family regulator
MKSVARAHPSIRVDLVETDLSAMTRLLNDGKIDLALTYRRTIPDTMPFMPLFDARPYAVMPEDSPLAGKSCVTLEDLAAMPMVLLDLPTAIAYFREVFSEHGLDLKIAHTTKSSSVLRGLVAAGFGHSILNICSPGDRNGENGFIVRPISGTVNTPLFGVAYTHASRRSALVQAVLEICNDMASQGAFEDLAVKPKAA